MRGKYLFPQSQYIPLTKRGLMGLRNAEPERKVGYYPSLNDINFNYEISSDASLSDPRDPSTTKILAYASTGLSLLGGIAGLSIVGVKTAAIITGSVVPIVGAVILVVTILNAIGVFNPCSRAAYDNQDGAMHQAKLDALLKPHFDDLARQTPVTYSQDDKVCTKLNEIATLICYLEMYWNRERVKTDWNSCSAKNLDLLKDKITNLKTFFLNKLNAYKEIYDFEIVTINVDFRNVTYRHISLETFTGYGFQSDNNWDLMLIPTLTRKPDYEDFIVPFMDFSDMRDGVTPKLVKCLEEPTKTQIKEAGKKLKTAWVGYDITLINGDIQTARKLTPEEWDDVARNNLGNSNGGVVVTPPTSTPLPTAPPPPPTPDVPKENYSAQELKNIFRKYFDGNTSFQEIINVSNRLNNTQIETALKDALEDTSLHHFKKWIDKRPEYICYFASRFPISYFNIRNQCYQAKNVFPFQNISEVDLLGKCTNYREDFKKFYNNQISFDEIKKIINNINDFDVFNGLMGVDVTFNAWLSKKGLLCFLTERKGFPEFIKHHFDGKTSISFNDFMSSCQVNEPTLKDKFRAYYDGNLSLEEISKVADSLSWGVMEGAMVEAIKGNKATIYRDYTRNKPEFNCYLAKRDLARYNAIWIKMAMNGTPNGHLQAIYERCANHNGVFKEFYDGRISFQQLINQMKNLDDFDCYMGMDFERISNWGSKYPELLCYIKNNRVGLYTAFKSQGQTDYTYSNQENVTYFNKACADVKPKEQERVFLKYYNDEISLNEITDYSNSMTANEILKAMDSALKKYRGNPMYFKKWTEKKPEYICYFAHRHPESYLSIRGAALREIGANPFELKPEKEILNLCNTNHAQHFEKYVNNQIPFDEIKKVIDGINNFEVYKAISSVDVSKKPELLCYVMSREGFENYIRTLYNNNDQEIRKLKEKCQVLRTPAPPVVQPTTPLPVLPTTTPVGGTSTEPPTSPTTPVIPSGTSTATENISVTEKKSGFPWWVLLLLGGGVYMATKKDKKSKKVTNE